MKRAEFWLLRNEFYSDRTIGIMLAPFVYGIDNFFRNMYATLELKCYGLNIPNESAILEGIYKMSLYESPARHATVVLLHDVPGRDMIELHVGNYPKDTKGCILVGSEVEGEDNMRAVSGSAVAMVDLIGLVRKVIELGYEPWLSIKDLRA